MNCPFDGSPLQAVVRHGIEIDWCPSCKGVWLERGELDRIIDRAEADADVRRPAPEPIRAAHRDDDWERRRAAEYYAPETRKKKKKKSFLSDMFEFD